MNVEAVDGDSLLRTLDGLAHKHIIVALKPLEIRGLLSELERVPGCQDSGKGMELTSDPCKRNVASVCEGALFGGKRKCQKAMRGPQ